MNSLRNSRRPIGSFLCVLTAFWQIAQPLQAAKYYWDFDANAVGNNIDGTGLGGSGTWDTTTANWWDLANDIAWPNTSADMAIFTGAFTALPTLNTVTLATGGVTANQLRFERSGYTITGDTLTLAGASAGLWANLGESATISSLIASSAGLTMDGGGWIRLGNNSNSYTGTTTINNGALVITSPSALGMDPSAVVVTRPNPVVGSASLRGYGGGSLVLDGTGGNIDFTRNLTLNGQGPWSDRGAALVSTGVNTLSGTVDMGGLVNGALVSTRIIAADGTLNLTGTLNVQGTAATTISNLGGVNQAGASFYNVSGVLAGTGTLESSGGGTLFLNPSDSSGFSGTIRVSGSAASGQSVVRIDSPGVLGTRTSGTTGAVLDLNGGVLAVLMDSPDVKVSNGSNANVYGRASSTIFADHTPNSSVKDQTVAFGNLSYEDNITLTFNSRNGYGMSFTTAPVNGGNANSTMTNNLQGGAQLTFTGNFWSNTDNGAARTMTIGGNGNTTINGNIIATSAAFNHNLTKTGTGTLTITGTGSTLDGTVNVNGGTVAINDWRAITNNTSIVDIGTTTTGATLAIIGNNVNQTNLTTSKVIRLGGTTGGATILANQTGTSPGLILNANFVATAGSASENKTVFLGGSNTAANTINGIIPNNAAGGLVGITKLDSGRWVLAGQNTYTGATTITNGTLQVLANGAASTVIADTSNLVFNNNNVNAGGTFEFVGQASANNVENLGALTPTSGAGTVKLTPGSGGTASLVFASLGTVNDTATVNITGSDASNKVTITGQSGLNASPRLFFGGSDFAYAGAGGVLRAPVYGTDADFAASTSTALTSTQSNEITGSFSNGEVTIDTLKINGAHTLTMTGTLTVRTGAANTDGAILQTGGSGTITGGTLSVGGTGSLTFYVDGGANTLSLVTPMGGTFSGGITKSGPGTLRLEGANTQTGTISINEGTIRLAGSGTLGGAAALTMRQDTFLELNGITPTNNINAFNNNGIVRNTSATTDVTLTVGGANGTGTSNGIIEDGGVGKISMVKIGTGNQSWLGLSTYTGTTTIGSTGLVLINNLQNGGQASGIGASSNAAGNLIFNGTSATQAYGGLRYTGTTNDETDRLFTLDGGANGGARIEASGANGATSTWTNTGAIAFGPNATGNPQGIVFGGTSTGDNRFSPIINDNDGAATSVYKADAGIWYLEATNTYTGPTTIRGGALYVTTGTSLPTASNLVLDGGSLARTGAFTRTIGTGANQVQWNGTSSGGFSAGGSSLTVDWGSGAVWGTTPGFLGTGAALLLNNSGVAKADVDVLSSFSLGAAVRTVTVGDFTSIGADFATISGVISGVGGGLLKNGAGILNLRGANTYDGTTQVSQGTLVVTTLGNSASPGATSVGDSTVGNTDTGAILLGNGGTTGGILEYVGLGETSDRKIRLNTTTGTNQIHADGVGSLILTNVANDLGSGAKTLSLRGVSSAANFITSQLSNNGGNLAITVDGSTAWILTNGANDYSGTTTVSAGALGIGADGALGNGNFDLSNGTTFAYGADRTLANPVRLVNSATTAFAGDYSLTFSNALQLLNAANNTALINNLVSGKTLTFAGATADSIDNNRTWTVDGSGTTIIAGNITTDETAARGLNLTKTGQGTLQLNGTASNFNRNNRVVDIDNGILRLGANEVIPHGLDDQTTPVVYGGISLTPDLVNGETATLDLNGFSETINALTMNTDGTAIIDNTSASAASLTFGAGDAAVSIGGGIGTYTIQNSGGGALSITKTGTAAAVIPTGVTLTYTGTTNVNGGSLTIASPVNGTTALSATNATTLALTGGITSPNLITSIEVGGGSTLSLLDGAGSLISNLTSLSLGNTGTGTVTLNLNVGDSATDTLTLLTGHAASLGNTLTFNMTDAGLSEDTTYTLLNLVDGGLSAFGFGSVIQGATPGGFNGMTWNVTDNLVQITTGTLIVGDIYWRGLTDLTWNGDADNWSTDKAGTTPAASIPGAGNKVIFAYNDVGTGPLVTTLEQNFKVNSLVFEAGTTTPASVTIAPGAVATNRIEIAPSVSSNGIEISAGGPAAVTISAPVRLGGSAASQTWNVVDSGSVLSLGSLLGEKDVTLSGPGKVILSAAADSTFNSLVTSDFIINAGTLEILDVSALGNPINSNLATVTVNNTGTFFYNGVASTATNLAMPITLNAGTLSAGTANQTYSGAVNVSGNSFVNMADSNGPNTNTARSITLSGVVSGSGDLTVSSNTTTLTGGNPEGGTFLISNAASTWTGDLTLTSGTVDIGAAASATVIPSSVTFDAFGRLIVRGVNGQTINQAGTMTFTAGTIGEYLLDNTSAVLAADFVVNQNGQVNIGSGGIGANARFTVNDAATQLNIIGNVVLGGNSSISVDGGDADSFTTISGVISEGGSGYSLAINNDAGGWAVGNDIIRLTGLNTFTGNITLAEGTLEFNTVTNISGGASSLGNGTAIATTNAATLRFIGTAAQSTDRPITTAGGALTLSANGDEAVDTVTYNGAITVGPTADGSQIILTGAAGRAGVISGGITQTGDTADMTVNGGTWTIAGGTSRVGDELTVTGADTIFNLNSGLFQVRDDFIVTAGATLNLNGTGVLSYDITTLSADSTLRATAGGIITLGANDAVVATQFDGLRIGVDASGVGTLNMGAFNQTVTEFILGNRNLDRTGIVNGTGTLTVTGNLDLYAGTINANLASSGANTLEKIGADTVTLFGDNSGLASTGSTIVYDGILALNYTVDNNTKLPAASALDLRGARVNVIGNNGSATAQSVGSLTLASGGSSTIQVTGGTGQEAVLNLGAITRGNLAQDGTIRFILPSGTQSATNGITTTSPNSTFGMLGTGASATSDAAYATVEDGTGTWFATASIGNIVALASTAKNDVTTWLSGDHITDETTGFTGTLQSAFINSLRFNTAVGSDVVMSDTGVLIIGSGGFLITSNVGGTPSMMNGTLASGATELVITQDSTQPFEIGSDIRINQGVTKTGAGTLRLSGNNVYTGVTEIQEGTLQATGNSIGDTSVVSLSASRPTTFELLADETIGRLQGGQRATDGEYGTVAVGSHTLTINHSGSNTTYSGALTGDGTIIKQGTHNWGLNNISAGFTGVFIVESGAVVISNIGQINANIIRINKGGALDFTNTSTTRSGTRVLDTTVITLNSADGTFQGETIVRGLSMRTDQDTTLDETVGLITLNTGANYVGMQATTTNDDSDIIINDLVRLNSSTLNVRGTNLGGGSAQENELRIGDATNQTAFIANAANLVGGGGAAASQNISIVPWAIGESTAGGLAATHMGNSLVTYTSGPGFRPLVFTEYNTFGSQLLATDNIRETITADLTALAGGTLNALVLNNNSIAAATHAVTGTGAGQSLAVTSGALLFTLNPAAVAGDYGITLGGFDAGITVGATNEYVIHVVNPDAGAPTKALTATIASPLTSMADITKSGRGTLILSAANTAGGGANRTTINEGILEISDLDNIGGDTGALVFAGGTLRLGTTLTDDISLRTITLLDGGGTIDTNTIDLALANSVGSGLGGLTKVGLGNLTLNAAATYTGATIVTTGTLTIGANNATGNGGALSIGAGATLALGANSITAGLVTTSGADPAITGTGTISASTGFFFDHDGGTDLVTVDAVLAGPGGVFKANRASNLTLNGLNTYTGTTEIQQGILSINSISNINGGPSALGNAANAESGIIRMGITTAATTLTYTGAGHSSDRLIGMQGTTGGVTLNGSGSGAIGYGGARFEMAGNKTLTLGGTSDAALINSIGALTEIGGVLTLIKTDTNTWNLNQSNSYTGATSINNGILRLSAVQNMTGALQFGSTTSITTAGSLEVQENATFGTMLVQTNSAVNTNNLSIDATKSLTINGNVTLGSSAATTTTLFAASGDGSFNVNNTVATGVTFLVGNSNTNISTADFSALGSMNVSLNPTAGILQVSSTSTTNSTGFGTLILAKDTTITASALTVGGGGSYNNNVGQVNSLKLGTTSNLINADTINIGTGLRDFGSVTFQDTTGTLVVRAADGTGRAAFNMGTTGGATGVATAAGAQNTFDVTGHNADLLLGAVAIGTQATRGDVLTNIFSFDTGTLDMTSLTMSVKTGTGLAGLKTVNSTVNLGGGTVVIGTINQMGQTSTAGNIANATLNVTGGNVTIGTGSGTAITMASANTGTTANSQINLTGGTTTITGNVVRTGGAGTSSAAITLNGGVLAMSGNSIGTLGENITFAAQSGTLSGLAELNGGGLLDKTTAGILSLGNGNAYTAGTTVSAGTLLASNTTGSATGSGSVSTLASTVLGGTGIIAPGSGNAVTVNGALQVGGTSPVAGQTLTIATTAAALTINNLLTFDLFLGEGSGPGPVNGPSTADRLLLTGNSSGASVVLGASSIFEITTTVSSGWAAGSSWQLIDWAGLVPTGNFSNLTSTVGNFSNLPDLSTFGLGWDVSAIYNTGVVSIAVIPEPSRAMLLLLGLLGLCFRRRRN